MVRLGSEILEFVWTVISYWQGIATAGIVSALIWAYGKAQKETMPDRYYFAVLIIFLPVSFFMAWRKERHAFRETKATLEATARPLLSGSIEQLVTGDVEQLGLSQMYLMMSIRNAGAPSIVDSWRLTIAIAGTERTVPPTFIPDGFTLRDDSGMPIAVFSKNETIYEKATTPIASGGMVRGWICFDLIGIKGHQVQQKGTVMTVLFRDVVGKTYEVRHAIEPGPSEEPRYYPGTNQPFSGYRPPK